MTRGEALFVEVVYGYACHNSLKGSGLMSPILEVV